MSLAKSTLTRHLWPFVLLYQLFQTNYRRPDVSECSWKHTARHFPRVLHLRRARLSSQAPLALSLASASSHPSAHSFNSSHLLFDVDGNSWHCCTASHQSVCVCVSGGAGRWWTVALGIKVQLLFAPRVPHSSHFHTDENRRYSLVIITTLEKTGTAGWISGTTSELLEDCVSNVCSHHNISRLYLVSSLTTMLMTNQIIGCCCFWIFFPMTN